MNKPREFWIGKHKIIVDEEFFPFISLYKWHVKKDKNTYYVSTNFYYSKHNRIVSMHRILTGMRNCSVDHKNRNGLDNRLENLRFATAQQNSCNRVRKNRFGYRGVYKPKNGNYAFQISMGKKRISGYGFKTAEDAARAYDIASKELHGEFGIRNFKDSLSGNL